MSQHRKHRGYATQRIVARWLNDHGWPYAHAIGAGEAGDDIQNSPGIQVEVKARRGFDPQAALRQLAARRQPGTVPFAVLRMDGTGETTIADWPCVIRLEDLTALLRQAGYGDSRDLTP
jgi:hypothetical protein